MSQLALIRLRSSLSKSKQMVFFCSSESVLYSFPTTPSASLLSLGAAWTNRENRLGPAAAAKAVAPMARTKVRRSREESQSEQEMVGRSFMAHSFQEGGTTSRYCRTLPRAIQLARETHRRICFPPLILLSCQYFILTLIHVPELHDETPTPSFRVALDLFP